jgi:hypothetical protein
MEDIAGRYSSNQSLKIEKPAQQAGFSIFKLWSA